MTHPLIDQLENAGLISDRRVDTRRVSKLSVGRLLDLSDEAASITAPTFEAPADTLFTHVSSLGLGGGASPCETLACRQKRLDDLARFAALYSDRVYIHNFLSDHANHVEVDNAPDIGHLRSRFADDVKLMAHLRPLIEAGRVVPLAMPSGRCSHCTVQDSYGEEAAKRSQQVTKDLAGRYLKEVTFTLEKLADGELDLSWTGPEELIEHGGGGCTLTELPEAIREDGAFMAALDREAIVTLSRPQVRLLGQHEAFAGRVLRSVAFEISVSQALKASFVTDRELEVNVLNAISEDPDVTARNRLVEQHLTTLVPFAADVPIARLLELRKREEESFLLFRNALTTAISEYQRHGKSFKELDARALYGDVIAPQLASLERRVQTAKKGIAAQIARDVTGWTAAISFGLYAGWVPAGIAAAAATLGLTQVGAKLLSQGLSARDDDAAVRNEAYYFLWKVRGAARQGAHRLSNRDDG